MEEHNNQSEFINSKNFITDRTDEKSDYSTLKFKISQELTNKIYRRSDQYIAGEIITVFSKKNSVNSISNHNYILNKEAKTYFLILCNKFDKNYLICPLFARSLLSCARFSNYEVSLGIISELEETKLMYADISRCHYINKAEFHNYMLTQGKLLKEIGEEIRVTRLQKDKLKLIIKKYKSMISS